MFMLLAAMSLTSCGGGSDAREPIRQPVLDTGPKVLTTTDTVVGNGAEAAAGKTAVVRLARWGWSATAPDFKGSRWSYPDLPQEIQLSAHPLAPQVADAILGMRVGGKRSAIIPGYMSSTPVMPPAQGPAPLPPLPGPLVVEIELLDLK